MVSAQTEESQAAPRGRRTDPERRCLVSRESGPVEGMIRFVVNPQGEICPDIDRKLPGRGLWLTARRDILQQACAANIFAATLRKPVSVPAGLADTVERLLERRCVELIGLGRRAGQAVAGFEKVRAAIRAEGIALLISASDGSVSERRRMQGQARGIAVVDSLAGAEIAAAFGRDYVAHAAMGRGRLADRLAVEGARLAGIRLSQDVKESG